jgi:hypothetical protein
VLRARSSREARRVGRNERERCLFIGTVLGQIEMHTADEVPGRISPFQELPQRLLRIGEFSAASRVHFSHSAASTSAFRYSPPGIGGAAFASSVSISVGGVSMVFAAVGPVAPVGCAHVRSVVT